MKNKILIISVGLIVVVIGLFVLLKHNTKSHSPADKVIYTEGELKIAIDYCKPYKKGRTIFSEAAEKVLQPYGTYWRMGANEATTFDVNKDVLINDKLLKAGKYQIYAVPNKEVWKIYFNTEWDRWGATEADHKTDVLETEVTANNEAPLQEQLILSFENKDSLGTALLVIHWDKTRVKIPFKQP